MIMMGTHFMDEIPFKDVYLHALVRDANGHKMSKSKGNVMDPLIVMDKYGTDAFRFTLTAFAAQGRDIRISEDRIEGYRHFINKIWNASRFALMHVNAEATTFTYDELSLLDKWILSRVTKTIRQYQIALDKFYFNEAASVVYQFVWHEFCDWYLEWVKPALFSDSAKEKAQTQAVLLQVMEIILKLLHPIAPFISEEIWHALPAERSFLMLESFPVPDDSWESDDIEDTVTLLMGVIGGIRNIRSEMQIHPSAEITAIIVCADEHKRQRILEYAANVTSMTKTPDLQVKASGECPKGAASYIYENIEIFVPMSGLIDTERELQKLAKEKEKISVQLKRTAGKLANKKFLANAPEDVISKEREKAAGFKATMAKIDENAQRLREID